MSLLVIGGTGTLGRQVVLQALIKGYKVRCLVRNFKKASFLKDWGVQLVYGDLTKSETLPLCLKGITAIIDCSTSRPDEFGSLKNVDWQGKLDLIEAAEIAQVKRFIFFSTQNLEEFQNIPFMKLKYGIEEKLKKSQISYTIFRLTGFYQGLIDQYAIPILEKFPILITNEKMNITYLDTQDIAKFCLKSLQIPSTQNKSFSLSGIKNWLSLEIITLCEELAGQKARIQKVPLFFLKFLNKFFSFFEWGQNVGNRLAFVEILNKNNFSKSTYELYKLFKMDSEEIIPLDDYFLEYFIRLLKRLRDINFEDVQKQRNLII